MSRSVYVIRSAPGNVKVGIAGRPRRRLAQLRTGSAVPLHLDFAAETEGDVAALERRVHEILDAKRMSGEWFSANVNEAIGAVIQAAQELDLDLQEYEATSISRTEKRSRGRPRTDATSIHLTLPPAPLAALDAYVAAQPEPRPTRPEAIRSLLNDGLAGLGYLPACADQKL